MGTGWTRHAAGALQRMREHVTWGGQSRRSAAIKRWQRSDVTNRNGRLICEGDRGAGLANLLLLIFSAVVTSEGPHNGAAEIEACGSISLTRDSRIGSRHY